VRARHGKRRPAALRVRREDLDVVVRGGGGLQVDDAEWQHENVNGLVDSAAKKTDQEDEGAPASLS